MKSASTIVIPEITGGSRIKEATIIKQCLKWANSLPNTYCYKRLAGPNRKGEPDISGASHGIRIEIEMKAPGNTPTTLQMAMISKWRNTGAIAGWADNLQEFKTIVWKGLMTKGVKLSLLFYMDEKGAV